MGNYTVSVILVEIKDGEEKQEVSFDFLIYITDLNFLSQFTVLGMSEKEKEESQGVPPTFKIISISKKGAVLLKFDQKMVIPGNFTEINQTVLRIEVKPGSASLLEQLAFIWNVTDYKVDTLEI